MVLGKNSDFGKKKKKQNLARYHENSGRQRDTKKMARKKARGFAAGNWDKGQDTKVLSE